MKYVLRLSVLAAAMFMMLPGRAMAADFGINPYIGLGLGMYDMKYSQTGFSQHNTAFGGVFKVGADFNDYLGAELRIGTTDRARSSYAAGTVDLSTDYMFSYLLKLQVPVSPEFRIYALGGGTSGKARITPSSSSVVTANAGKNATGASFGGGIDYQVNDSMWVGIEGIRYWNNVKVNITGFPESKMTVDAYTATLRIMM